MAKIWEVFNFDSPIFKHEPLERILLKFAFGYELQSNDLEMGISTLEPSDYDEIFLIDFQHTECQWLMVKSNNFGMRSGRSFVQTIDFDFRTQEDLNSSDDNGPKHWLKAVTTLMVNSEMDVFSKGK